LQALTINFPAAEKKKNSAYAISENIVYSSVAPLRQQFKSRRQQQTNVRENILLSEGVLSKLSQ
jgi:pantothenate kinase type III